MPDARSNAGGAPLDGSPLTVVGIDDETPDTAATASVIGDDLTLVRLELRAGQPVQPVDVDVRGVERLTLAVHGSTPTPAHVDWVGPTLHRSPPTGRTWQ